MLTETAAQFPGGTKAMFEFISKNLSYSGGCSSMEGTVFITFIVEVNGQLTHEKIKKTFHELASEEALRVLDKMPDWLPASCDGIFVPIYFTLPIRLKFRP